MKKKDHPQPDPGRRSFLSNLPYIGALPFLTDPVFYPHNESKPMQRSTSNEANQSIIGQYGPWAAQLTGDPPALSFRNPAITDLATWRAGALNKTRELIAVPVTGSPPVPITTKKYKYDGLEVEELQWQLGFGRPTRAIFLKPENASGALPAILGLHDHGGQKYFGHRKITRTSDQMHPTMEAHQNDYYSGRAWANQLAKRGYAVLVHDVFTFGSRRVFYQDISQISWGDCNVADKNDDNPEAIDNINAYNQWAGAHEHIMAKSLFCAGTTWPGITLYEDQAALDVLSARPEVDAQRIGCCGLSGGGLRTDYLGGLDERIKCAVSVGFMSTWNDFLLHKAYTHTWMIYVPLLAKYLDFPEILGLRVPLPTMVQYDEDDQLYTLPEMKRADQQLQQVFEKAGAAERYKGRFYPGEHKFDQQMQEEAFDWFDQWLGQ